MTPHADFVCGSKFCLTDEGATVYELPIDATHCPKGHKRLKRLFNKIGVIGLRAMRPEADWRLTSSSALQRSKALLQDSFDAADKQKASAQEMPTWGTGNVEREVSTKQGKFLVPSRQDLARQFGLAGPGAPMTQIEVAREIKRDRLSVPAVLHELNKKPIPTVVVGQPR
jgi:hypothetical protein